MEISSYNQKISKHGLFIRKPWVFRSYDGFGSMYNGSFNPSFFQILLMLFFMPKYFIRKLKFDKKHEDNEGLYLPYFINPFYNTREGKGFLHLFSDHPRISEIYGWGYEHEYNEAAGYCEKEFTTIEFLDGKIVKLVNKNKYNFYYSHLLEDVLSNKALVETLYRGENVNLSKASTSSQLPPPEGGGL